MKIRFLNWIFLMFILLNTGVLLYGTGSERTGKVEVKTENEGEYEKIEPRYVETDELEIREGKIYIKGEREPLTGTITQYYSDGEIEAEYNIEKGLREGVAKVFYQDGKMKSELVFSNDKLEGNIKEFFENGNIESVVEYKNDVADGIGIFYYETGEVRARVNYKNGLLNGELTEYYEDGRVIHKLMYKDGEVIESLKDVILKNIVLTLVILVPLVCLPFSLMKIFKDFPSMTALDGKRREEVLNLFIKYNDHLQSLHSSYSINGTGTRFYRISKFRIDNGLEIRILAKMFSFLWIPLPFTKGYLACYDKDKIIASVSRKTFRQIKEEINDKILQYSEI